MNAMSEELAQFVERMKAAAGANLESIVLYGSAARDDFDENYSDVNLLCILRETSGEALRQISSVVHWWSHELRQRPPLVLTAEELKSSADVFAIETLDVKRNGRVLHGRDVLSGVDVHMNLHRIQLEHELRTLLLRLRHQYLLAPDNERELEKVLAKSASSMVVLLRHALIAVGHPVIPQLKHGVVSAAAETFSIDVSAVNAALDIREGRRTQRGIATVYQAYMDTLAAVIRRIDEAVPTREWRRVGLSSC